MRVLSGELVDRLAGYIVDRRDKRIITFTVLALYAAALLYHFIAPALGAPEQKTALDSIETLAMVVVVAHIAGGAVQRKTAAKWRPFGEAANAASPPAAAPGGTAP